VAIVELLDVTKTYALHEVEVHALRGISFSVAEGEYCAIVGPSGSGKSTLLNLLGCLDRPTSGTYRLGGRDVSGMSDDELSDVRATRIGFIFQSFNLLPQLSVLDNIEVPLFYQGVSPAESRKRSAALAARVGLADRASHRPAELSGGQQQRVAIARSLANDPILVLADEPTGNLDTATGREILALLDELHASGKTILLVSHDPNVAARAERIVEVVDGKVARDERKGDGENRKKG
jgi:putative ABC transport system ATP-binding protein